MENEGKSVLVVDDEYYVTRAISYLLKEEGIRCITKNDVDGITEILDKDAPEVILLDINLPKKDGFAICRDIRANEKYNDMKIIFLTARGQQEDINKGMKLGAEDYILKPFNPIELLDKIKVLLAKS